MNLKKFSSISVAGQCGRITVGGNTWTVLNEAETKTAGDVVKYSITAIHTPECVAERRFSFKGLFFVGIYTILVFAVLFFGK